MHYSILVLPRPQVRTVPSVFFFQRNWDVLKVEITAIILEFFESGIMPDGVNDTAILLS